MAATLAALADQAAQRLTDSNEWFGTSGHRVTGAAVADHLSAAADLMERENWDPQLYNRFSGHHLRDALSSAIEDGQGDADTYWVACKVMEKLLEVVLDAPYVDCRLWSEHASRTLAEVVTLCRTAARIAQKVGPKQPGVSSLPLP